MRCLIAFFVSMFPLAAQAQEAQQRPSASDAAIKNGLAFLVRDAHAWKKVHNCVSCHHAGLVLWALGEAKRAGHAVDEPMFAEYTKWVAGSGEGKTGVARPAGRPKALNAKAVWLALGLTAAPELDLATKKGVGLLVKTMKSDQIDNGSWVAWPETRPPIFGPSDDSMTALATLALMSAAEAGDDDAKSPRDKGVAWLAKTKCDDDPQSVALRLVIWKRLGRFAEECEPLIRRIRAKQNADGGWSQANDMASDAWATGQALFALSHADLKPADPAIERGQSYLMKTQRADGSWPMTSRPTKPGDKGSPGLIPITGAGSAWAVIGLARSGRIRETGKANH